MALLALLPLIKVQELVILLEFLCVLSRQEGACLLPVPLWNQNVQILRGHVRNLKVTKVKQVRHQIPMREYCSFISKLIEPWVGERVARSDPAIGLVYEHFRDEVDSIYVRVFGENLNKREKWLKLSNALKVI